MSSTFTQQIDTLEETEELGRKIARAIKPCWQSGVTVYLNGGLGAGKTTLSRYILRELGHRGNVKSPTYTLVEPYELKQGNAYHFDLYRLADPEELEFMGVRDYFSPHCLCLIEWAEKGASYLAPADIQITLCYESSRHCNIEAFSSMGETIVQACRHND